MKPDAKLILIPVIGLGITLVSSLAMAAPPQPEDDKRKRLTSKPPTRSSGGGSSPPPKSGGIDMLEPEMLRKYLLLEQTLANKYGMKLLRGRTRASIAEGRKNYENGVSSIKSGISWHTLGRAIDVYPYDPKTGKPDMMGRNQALFRKLHQEWFKLGGYGLAYLPYPNGPIRRLKGKKGAYWDGGHLEWHGPFKSLAVAYAAEKNKIPAAYA
jgi:hypothetical protein